MTDESANFNLISSRIFKEFSNKQSKIHQRNLITEQIYRDVIGAPFLTCKSEAKIDVFMHIRNISRLNLRKNTGKITEEDIPCPILERRVQ